jgi:endothelin-converting enzyme/putative endopeptidase
MLACSEKPAEVDTMTEAAKKTATEILEKPVSEKTVAVSGIDTAGFDKSVRVQDDFYEHVNGTWLKTTEIPADKSNYSMFAKLADEAEVNIRTIIEETSKNTNADDGSAPQKIRDYYNTYTNKAESPTVNLDGLKDELSLIENISNHDELIEAFGTLGKIGISNPIGGYIYSDLKNPDVYEVYLSQSGISLPDRDYYLEDKEQFTKGIALLKTYIETVFTLAGDDNGADIANEIVELEKQIATHMWPKEKNRNPDLRYNLKTLAEIKELAPGIAWEKLYAAAGIPLRDKYIVNQPDFFQNIDSVIQETPLATWKNYLTLKAISQYADVLGKPFYDAQFDFTSKGLSGIEEQRPLWKRAVGSTENVMGELLGQLYVEKHFKPEAKTRMLELVDNLKKAYAASIKDLDWMSEETKVQALDKLANFRTKIGYPDQWRDYSDLEIIDGDIVGNDKRAALFEYNYVVNKLGKPVDKEEWGMTPQTVNAYYQPAWNEIVFPAAILQPPFFNIEAEDAVNYGGIGAVIGHEIGHGFDDQGRKYDGTGKLRDWWTQTDNEKFEFRKKKLAAQYDSYVAIDDLHVNGEFTSGENIGDLGGLSIAFKAYKMSLNGEDGPVIDGMTADQRVFYGWGQVWRRLYRDAELKKRLTTDPHSPARFRGNGAVINIPGFYEAFDVKEGDGMYLAPENRVKIW